MEVQPQNLPLTCLYRPPPVFACGNVRSGGDIAMLTYSLSSPHPSFQLLTNYDDGDREFAYDELDNASLTPAQQNNWQVISSIPWLIQSHF